MHDETRAHLVAWQAEIQAEIPGAEAAVTTARGQLAHATRAEIAERNRVRDLRTAVQLPPGCVLASVIAARLAEAAKAPPGFPSVRVAELALETAERNLADLLEALQQINFMLSPPAARPVTEDERQAATVGDGFDPIIMPARAA